jgi:hypothetical protein
MHVKSCPKKEKIRTYNKQNKATRTGVQMWRVKTANEIPAHHLLIMAFPMAMQVYTNDEKPAHIRFYSKRSHTITRNEWQH